MLRSGPQSLLDRLKLFIGQMLTLRHWIYENCRHTATKNQATEIPFDLIVWILNMVTLNLEKQVEGFVSLLNASSQPRLSSLVA